MPINDRPTQFKTLFSHEDNKMLEELAHILSLEQNKKISKSRAVAIAIKEAYEKYKKDLLRKD